MLTNVTYHGVSSIVVFEDTANNVASLIDPFLFPIHNAEVVEFVAWMKN